MLPTCVRENEAERDLRRRGFLPGLNSVWAKTVHRGIGGRAACGAKPSEAYVIIDGRPQRVRAWALRGLEFTCRRCR